MNVQIRVESVWNASVMMSNIVPDVLAVSLGDAAGARCMKKTGGCRWGETDPGKTGRRRVGPGDPLFDLAHRGQVVLQLAAVTQAQPAAKLMGVFEGEVEDALLVEVTLLLIGAVAGLASADEQAVEDRTRVDLLGHRRGGRAPGDVRRIGAAIARVAVARLSAPLDAQLERGQPGLAADLLGGNLVGRDPDVDVGPISLERMYAREEARERPGMIAAAVTECLGVVLGQAGEHQQVVLEWPQRLEDPGEVEPS